MSILNHISRGFGGQLGRTAANKVTSGPINSLFNMCWQFVKWCIIIAFTIGLIQGLFSK